MPRLPASQRSGAPLLSLRLQLWLERYLQFRLTRSLTSIAGYTSSKSHFMYNSTARFEPGHMMEGLEHTCYGFIAPLSQHLT